MKLKVILEVVDHIDPNELIQEVGDILDSVCLLYQNSLLWVESIEVDYPADEVDEDSDEDGE